MDFSSVLTDPDLGFTAFTVQRTAYTAPDRILWNGRTWRVVQVRDWSGFGYHQALAIRTHE